MQSTFIDSLVKRYEEKLTSPTMAAGGGILSARLVPTATLLEGKVPIVGAWINIEIQKMNLK